MKEIVLISMREADVIENSAHSFKGQNLYPKTLSETFSSHTKSMHGA